MQKSLLATGSRCLEHLSPLAPTPGLQDGGQVLGVVPSVWLQSRPVLSKRTAGFLPLAGNLALSISYV